MSEKIEGGERKPKIIRQSKKPKEKLGIKCIPVRDDPWKRSRITGWMPISTEPPPIFSPEMEELSEKPPRKVGGITEDQLEKSRKKSFPTFIEESLPKGDRD